MWVLAFAVVNLQLLQQVNNVSPRTPAVNEFPV